MPRYYYNRNVYICSTEDSHKNVLNSTIPKNPVVETTQLFTNNRTEEFSIGYSQYGVLYSNENEYSTKSHNLDKSQKHNVE